MTPRPFNNDFSMKKAIISLLLLAAGCSEATAPDSQVKTNPFPDSGIRIYDVQHGGHNWVVFFKQGAYSAVMDVHHDPDCPCQKEDQQ